VTADVQSARTANASPTLIESIREQVVALRGDGPAPPPSLFEIAVERAGELKVARPADWGLFREEEALGKRLTPYWAVPWPSGLALTRVVAGAPPKGKRVLELGCGLALPSIAAARGGAHRVLATDVNTDAVVFAAHNMLLNDVVGETAAGDWSELDGEWDLILAADVLYTRENIEPLLDVLRRTLAPGGEVWLADPKRATANVFLPIAKKIWSVDSREDRDDDRVMHHRITASTRPE
jgi:predicted nicotinamide N-methyase